MFASTIARSLGIILLTIGIGSCSVFEPESHSTPEVDELLPLPQDPFVKVYFNHNLADRYTEPYRQQVRPGDNLEAIIIETIASATTSVDVAVQEFRLPNIARSLVDRAQAGVRVRVILENTSSRSWGDFSESEIAALDRRDRDRYEAFLTFADTNADGELSSSELSQSDALTILREAGIPVIDDTADGSQGSGLMHHKFVVVDGKTAIVTSANFTLSGTHGDFDLPVSRGNANNLLRIENDQIATILTEEFNLMWGDGPAGKTDSKFGIQKTPRSTQNVTVGDSLISVRFSPSSSTVPRSQTTNGLIAQALDRANNSINLALFVFSDQTIVDTIQTRYRDGIAVRGVFDSGFAYRYYSEAIDMLGVAIADNQCRYEPGNDPWENPLDTVGVPQLPPGDKLHHKFAVVDNRIVITGSHNWSEVANTDNDETLIIIQNSTVAAHFQREFDRLYEISRLGVTNRVTSKLEEQRDRCQTITQRPATTKVESGETVNINTASQAELERLPGIGPALAQRIIAAREESPFTSLEDLDRVSGIGEKTLEDLRGYVTW